ncbi:thymidylate synthase [Fictibacillus nanhaiensis]|nr:thymidylate synthase [Fictibacillus nanhaiensis]
MLIHPDNTEELFLNITDAQLKYNISDLSPILAGKVGRKFTKGYTAKYINDELNLYRYELSKNQVFELLHNIKNNSSSRRLLTSFWNHADVDKKQLQECVWHTQWLVKEGKLHLIVGIRSNDMALGNPFNVFQYYVLQRMIAQVTSYQLGTLTFNINDAHVYERHIGSLNEQILREQFEAPTLWINPDVKNFYEFTIDDFKLENYKHGDKLNFEVAL